MENLVERILKLRGEIATLNREKRAIQSRIDKYSILLEDLEILSVNQLDMFPEDGEKKICKYTEEKNRLHHILVMRSVEKTDKYDSEIKDLQAKVDLFEYGIL